MADDAEVEDELVQTLNAISIASPDNDNNSNDNNCHADECCDENDGRIRILLLDAGYGFPREKKVRKEKINAIASQLSNFLIWQTTTDSTQYATVRVVGCPDENMKTLIENRTIENMKRASSSSSASNSNNNNLPSHVTVACETLEECLEDLASPYNGDVEVSATNDATTPVYLSPDAHESLDPSSEPPKIAVVGLLIDRRIQPNRSRDRADNLGIVARRWPLEDCFAEIDACEPLNVDCVLEGMQQWWWNWSNIITTNSRNDDAIVDKKAKKETFIQAASQAIEHHAERHPSRPLHISKQP